MQNNVEHWDLETTSLDTYPILGAQIKRRLDMCVGCENFMVETKTNDERECRLACSLSVDAAGSIHLKKPPPGLDLEKMRPAFEFWPVPYACEDEKYATMRALRSL